MQAGPPATTYTKLKIRPYFFACIGGRGFLITICFYICLVRVASNLASVNKMLI